MQIVRIAVFGLLAAAASLAQMPPSIGHGAPLQLSAQQAIELALRSNLDVQIERYSLDLNRLRIAGATGFYDPQVTFSANANSTTTPITSVLQGNTVASINTSARGFNFTVQQNLLTGGNLSLQINDSRNTTNDTFSFVNPLFGSSMNLTLTQPLLRGMARNPQRRQLRILNLDARIGEAQFRQAVSEMLLRVLQQYWELKYALEASKVRQESRQLAASEREQIQQKVQAGLLTPIALASASAEVALREQDIIQGEVQVVRAENALKSLLASNPSDDIWRRTLVPTDWPKPQPVQTTLVEAIDKALHDRPELQASRFQRQQNQIDRDFLKWETKPQVNLVAGIGSIGQAGQVYDLVTDPQSLLPTGRVLDPAGAGFGGLGTATGQVFGFSYPNWSVAVNVQLPILNRAAKANAAQADVTGQRLQAQLKQQQQAIMVEVANAYETVRLQLSVLDVARQTRELSKQQLDGETQRFEAGFTTHFEVLRYQRDLDDARLRELRATVDYEIALAAMRKAIDTLADENDLVIAKATR
jgi:outer membrane protein TolC